MKTQHQILTSPADYSVDRLGQTRMGYAICPYCETKNYLVSSQGSPMYADGDADCQHNRGAVDAGSFKTAIHFVGEKS
jgi:hypothetical protein